MSEEILDVLKDVETTVEVIRLLRHGQASIVGIVSKLNTLRAREPTGRVFL